MVLGVLREESRCAKRCFADAARKVPPHGCLRFGLSLVYTGVMVTCSLLCKEDGSFAPAYMLADNRMERAGRGSQRAADDVLVPHSLTRTAAVVIIGDEILAAKVQDVNTYFLCSELHAIGWRVCKVRCVSIL